MESPEVVPDCVVLLVGHPGAGHEHEEEHVHDEQHDDQSENLSQGRGTMLKDMRSFLLTR